MKNQGRNSQAKFNPSFPGQERYQVMIKNMIKIIKEAADRENGIVSEDKKSNKNERVEGFD